jgi:hypothetical protein
MERNVKKTGFATLTTIIIVTIAGLLFIMSYLAISTDSIKTASSSEDALKARAIAEACAEIALDKLRINNSYSGNETVATAVGQCVIESISSSGQSRQLTTRATVQKSTKRVRVECTLESGTLMIKSWNTVGG